MRERGEGREAGRECGREALFGNKLLAGQHRCSRMTSRAIMNVHQAYMRALVGHNIHSNGLWL